MTFATPPSQHGATGNEVDDDGEGATGDGATGDDDKGATGDVATGIDDDDDCDGRR